MTARLRAIVAVDYSDRVQCQNPGCGHSVYAAVHVVEDGDRLLVLGSTCFIKRYGGANALGAAQYGGGGGRKLTALERAMLVQNTAALLAHFAAQDAAARRNDLQRLESLRLQQEQRAEQQRRTEEQRRPHAVEWNPARRSSNQSGMRPQAASPWPWQKDWTSVAVFTSPLGQCWVRVQHRDNSQKLVPWPAFEGWDTALPSGVGVADRELGAVATPDIVEAFRILRRHGYSEPRVGTWQQVLPRRGSG